jgi:hypothetical protein
MIKQNGGNILLVTVEVWNASRFRRRRPFALRCVKFFCFSGRDAAYARDYVRWKFSFMRLWFGDQFCARRGCAARL